MAQKNRSKSVDLTVSLPYQTHAYLVKLAERGALGQTEALIGVRIIINKVEKLMKAKRAETMLAAPSDVADRPSD
jgi:hypothetical protein